MIEICFNVLETVHDFRCMIFALRRFLSLSIGFHPVCLVAPAAGAVSRVFISLLLCPSSSFVLKGWGLRKEWVCVCGGGAVIEVGIKLISSY